MNPHQQQNSPLHNQTINHTLHQQVQSINPLTTNAPLPTPQSSQVSNNSIVDHQQQHTHSHLLHHHHHSTPKPSTTSQFRTGIVRTQNNDHHHGPPTAPHNSSSSQDLLTNYNGKNQSTAIPSLQHHNHKNNLSYSHPDQHKNHPSEKSLLNLHSPHFTGSENDTLMILTNDFAQLDQLQDIPHNDDNDDDVDDVTRMPQQRPNSVLSPIPSSITNNINHQLNLMTNFPKNDNQTIFGDLGRFKAHNLTSEFNQSTLIPNHNTVTFGTIQVAQQYHPKGAHINQSLEQNCSTNAIYSPTYHQHRQQHYQQPQQQQFALNHSTHSNPPKHTSPSTHSENIIRDLDTTLLADTQSSNTTRLNNYQGVNVHNNDNVGNSNSFNHGTVTAPVTPLQIITNLDTSNFRSDNVQHDDESPTPDTNNNPNEMSHHPHHAISLKIVQDGSMNHADCPHQLDFDSTITNFGLHFTASHHHFSNFSHTNNHTLLLYDQYHQEQIDYEPAQQATATVSTASDASSDINDFEHSQRMPHLNPNTPELNPTVKTPSALQVLPLELNENKGGVVRKRPQAPDFLDYYQSSVSSVGVDSYYTRSRAGSIEPSLDMSYYHSIHSHNSTHSHNNNNHKNNHSHNNNTFNDNNNNNNLSSTTKNTNVGQHGNILGQKNNNHNQIQLRKKNYSNNQPITNSYTTDNNNNKTGIHTMSDLNVIHQYDQNFQTTVDLTSSSNNNTESIFNLVGNYDDDMDSAAAAAHNLVSSSGNNAESRSAVGINDCPCRSGNEARDTNNTSDDNVHLNDTGLFTSHSSLSFNFSDAMIQSYEGNHQNAEANHSFRDNGDIHHIVHNTHCSRRCISSANRTVNQEDEYHTINQQPPYQDNNKHINHTFPHNQIQQLNNYSSNSSSSSSSSHFGTKLPRNTSFDNPGPPPNVQLIGNTNGRTIDRLKSNPHVPRRPSIAKPTPLSQMDEADDEVNGICDNFNINHNETRNIQQSNNHTDSTLSNTNQHSNNDNSSNIQLTPSILTSTRSGPMKQLTMIDTNRSFINVETPQANPNDMLHANCVTNPVNNNINQTNSNSDLKLIVKTQPMPSITRIMSGNTPTWLLHSTPNDHNSNYENNHDHNNNNIKIDNNLDSNLNNHHADWHNQPIQSDDHPHTPKFLPLSPTNLKVPQNTPSVAPFKLTQGARIASNTTNSTMFPTPTNIGQTKEENNKMIPCSNGNYTTTVKLTPLLKSNNQNTEQHLKNDNNDNHYLTQQKSHPAQDNSSQQVEKQLNALSLNSPRTIRTNTQLDHNNQNIKIKTKNSNHLNSKHTMPIDTTNPFLSLGLTNPISPSYPTSDPNTFVINSTGVGHQNNTKNTSPLPQSMQDASNTHHIHNTTDNCSPPDFQISTHITTTPSYPTASSSIDRSNTSIKINNDNNNTNTTTPTRMSISNDSSSHSPYYNNNLNCQNTLPPSRVGSSSSSSLHCDARPNSSTTHNTSHPHDNSETAIIPSVIIGPSIPAQKPTSKVLIATHTTTPRAASFIVNARFDIDPRLHDKDVIKRQQKQQRQHRKQQIPVLSGIHDTQQSNLCGNADNLITRNESIATNYQNNNNHSTSMDESEPTLTTNINDYNEECAKICASTTSVPNHAIKAANTTATTTTTHFLHNNNHLSVLIYSHDTSRANSSSSTTGSVNNWNCSSPLHNTNNNNNDNNGMNDDTVLPQYQPPYTTTNASMNGAGTHVLLLPSPHNNTLIQYSQRQPQFSGNGILTSPHYSVHQQGDVNSSNPNNPANNNIANENGNKNDQQPTSTPASTMLSDPTINTLSLTRDAKCTTDTNTTHPTKNNSSSWDDIDQQTAEFEAAFMQRYNQRFKRNDQKKSQEL